jgi:hypothetical protein
MAISTGAAILGGTLGSALLGSRASKKAATTQAESTREGMEAQERMFERQLELQEPFRQGGIEAQNMLMRELRSPRQYRATGAGGGFGMDPRAIQADPEGYQRMLAAAQQREAQMPGSTFLGQGGGGVSLAPGDIAQQRFQGTAGLGPGEIGMRQFQGTAGLSPGEIGMRQFQGTAGLSPGELGTEQFNFEADPGYGFRLSEGLKALERSAAARGGLMSGGAGKALQRYGQDLASQEYGNAFQRFQQDRAARAGLGQMEYGRFADEQARRMGAGQAEYGRFADEQARRMGAGQAEYGRFADDISRRMGLGQMEYGQFAGERSARLLPLMQTVQSGQGLTSNIAGQMANLGAAQAGAAGQIGAAGAAGQIGAANALMSGIGQGANLYMQNQMMDRYFGRGSAPLPYYSPSAMTNYASQYGQGSL